MTKDQIVKNCVLSTTFFDKEYALFYVEGYLDALVDSYKINRKEAFEIKKEILNRLGF